MYFNLQHPNRKVVFVSRQRRPLINWKNWIKLVIKAYDNTTKHGKSGFLSGGRTGYKELH